MGKGRTDWNWQGAAVGDTICSKDLQGFPCGNSEHVDNWGLRGSSGTCGRVGSKDGLQHTVLIVGRKPAEIKRRGLPGLLSPTSPLVGTAAEPRGTSSFVGSVFLVGVGDDLQVRAIRANDFSSGHPWVGAIASKTASFNEGISRRFLRRSFVLAKSVLGLAWISGDDIGGCSPGGHAWWNLDVKSLAAGDAACDVLKLMDFVLG